ASGALRRLTHTKEKEEVPSFSPDDAHVAFVRGGNLFVVDLGRAVERALTRDGADDVLDGLLDWVYQEEVYGRGTFRGYWWSPDSRRVLYQVQDRVQTWLDLDETDAATLRTRTLLREKTEAWVDRQDKGLHWLPDGGFLWLSERTGWKHIYRYRADGTLVGP